MRLFVLVLGVAVAILAPVTFAQTFDAASIKESPDTGTTGGGMRLLPNGDIRVQHMPARSLITIAHQIERYQLANAPEWTAATCYDITAKANATTTREETFAMMRALLAERFKFAFHRDMREVQGFAVVRGSDSEAPGLTRSAVNCEENPRGPRCTQGGISTGSFMGFGIPVATIMRFIGVELGAPVVDDTGLTGTFDVSLHWSGEPTPSDDAPVLPTAIREQLGLRLERRQVRVEVLVVDHIERPSAN